MTGDPPALSRFELAARELRALGIVMTRLPGEYRVNFRTGTDATARTVETLDQALELGRTTAADAPAPPSPAHGKRGRRPRRMTPKAIRRRMIHAPGAQSPHASAGLEKGARPRHRTGFLTCLDCKSHVCFLSIEGLNPCHVTAGVASVTFLCLYEFMIIHFLLLLSLCDLFVIMPFFKQVTRISWQRG
jgi:hypothetical protein